MKQKPIEINYISHLSLFYEKVYADNRLCMGHVSLYLALFQFWNLNRFKNPISLCRSEVMQLSKIGSTNSYTKYLKDLHHFGYLVYVPSFNPNIGSTVNLFTFDNSTDKGSGKGSDKGRAIVVRPSINSNKLNKQLNSKNIDREKSSTAELFPSPEKEKKNSVFRKPTLEQLQEYFTSEKSTNQEAQKFYLHYESNGWMVGKTKMKNWKAAAKNWITRSSNFSKPNPLSTHQNKNYSEPL